MQRFLLGLLALDLWACISDSGSAPIGINSPDGRLQLQAGLDESGQAYYTLARDGNLLIDTSRLGFELQAQPELAGNLRITGTATRSFSETWEPLWGEEAQVENTYEELTVDLEEQQAPRRTYQLIFRLFDDGLGFRYHFPAQEAIGKQMVVMDEHSHFQLTGDHLTWWQPGDWDIYEHLYNTTRFSEIDALTKRSNPNLAQTYIPENAVNTPVTMRTEAGIHLSFHEANLTDYAGMTLRVNKEDLRWESELVGAPDGSKATVSLPFSTPWRTIQVAERAGDLIESKLIVNLNEPSVLEDTDWIKPMKYVGIWWEMHLDKSTWDLASGRHGATTENAKRYIDFTLGIFDIKFDEWKPDNQVSTTLAKQLALYVTLYGPLQMAADLPENYEGQPAIEFIRQVPVDWDESRVLNGEVGDYVTIVRKEKDSERWFLGSITDAEARSFDIELDFLEAGRAYRAFMYVDAADAHWDDKPLAIDISDMLVESGQTLPVRLAPGGGAAIYFEPVEN